MAEQMSDEEIRLAVEEVLELDQDQEAGADDEGPVWIFLGQVLDTRPTLQNESLGLDRVCLFSILSNERVSALLN